MRLGRKHRILPHEVYLRAYQHGREARISLSNYFRSCDNERPLEAVGYLAPTEGFTHISALVALTEENILESLIPDSLSIGEPDLNIGPIWSWQWVHFKVL